MNTDIPDRNNSREFAKHISEVTAAFAEGKKVEYRWLPNGTDRRGGEWKPVTAYMGTHWSFMKCDYRIALEPPKEQWKPYTFETAPMTVKAKRKGHTMSDVARLTGGEDQGFWFNGTYYTFQRALNELEQLDGTPLGVKVESEPEWPKYVRGIENGLLIRFNADGSEDARYASKPDKWDRHVSSYGIDKYISGKMGSSYTRITAAEAAELLGKDGSK
jgi:hypothetical protein